MMSGSKIRKRVVMVVACLGLFAAVGCTPVEQELFFVKLGDSVAQTQSLEEAKSNWTPEKSTPAQFNVLVALQNRQRQTAVSGDCYQAVDKYFSGPKAWFKGIVTRESRNIPSAANPSSSARGCAQLLMSIHAHRYYAVGCKPSDWANPDCNIKAADHLYRQAGTSPWRI